MNKLVKILNRLDKLMDRREVLFQTIKPEVVEPPSPQYTPPHINSLTYWAKMNNNMAENTPLDYSLVRRIMRIRSMMLMIMKV